MRSKLTAGVPQMTASTARRWMVRWARSSEESCVVDTAFCSGDFVAGCWHEVRRTQSARLRTMLREAGFMTAISIGQNWDPGRSIDRTSACQSLASAIVLLGVGVEAAAGFAAQPGGVDHADEG